jgi:hypothetical protein
MPITNAYQFLFHESKSYSYQPLFFISLLRVINQTINPIVTIMLINFIIIDANEKLRIFLIFISSIINPCKTKKIFTLYIYF